MHVRPLVDDDRPWLRALLGRHWGSVRVVTRGRLHDAGRLPGLAMGRDGYLLYELREDALEVVVVHALLPRRGIGRALVEAAVELARGAGCRRAWLVTTNDNRPAIDFYRALGWRLAAVHVGAIAASRRLKPEIPARGVDDVPIEDEWEFELLLDPAVSSSP